MSKYSAFYTKENRVFTCNQPGCNYKVHIKPGGSTNSLRHHLKFSHPAIDIPPSDRKRILRFFDNPTSTQEQQDQYEFGDKKIRLEDLVGLAEDASEGQENENTLGRIPSGFEWDLNLNIHNEEPGHSQEMKQEPVNTPIVRPEKMLNSNINRTSENSVLKVDRFEEHVLALLLTTTFDFNMVETAGFKTFVTALSPSAQLQPGRHYRDVILPRVYRRIMDKIGLELTRTEVVSLSIEMFPMKGDSKKIMTVNAHFPDKNLKLTDRLLQVVVITNEDDVRNVLSELMAKYTLEKKLHLVIRPENLKISTKSLGRPSYLCFGEMVNQSILKTLEYFPEWMILLDKLCRTAITLKRVSGFDDFLYKHSEVFEMTKNGIELQNLDWRFLHELLCLFSDSSALSLPMSTNSKNDTTLSDQDFQKIKGLLNILEVIKTATAMDNITIGHLIPIYKLIEKKLMSDMKDDALRQMRTMIFTGISERLGDFQDNKFLVFSTLLHPRFKGTLFSASVIGTNFSRFLKEAMDFWSKKILPLASDPFAELISAPVEFDTIDDATLRTEIISQWTQFLSEPVKVQTAHDFWNDTSNKERFSRLFPLALRYLSAPAMTSSGEEMTKTKKMVNKNLLRIHDDEELSKMILLRVNLSSIERCGDACNV